MTRTSQNSKLYCVDRGEGTPVLLVHGFPLDHTMWNHQIDALASRYRVLAPDLRGFGRSPMFGGDRATMAELADDLVGLLDARGVNDPVVLCGLSMGGYIALQFWQNHAKRLRALVLCDTRAAADSSDVAAGRRVAADRVLREGVGSLVEGMTPRVFGASTQRLRPERIEPLRRVMLSSDPHAVAAAQRGMADRPDMRSRLGEIRCPALIVVGREDVSSPPAEMRTVADAIPGARYVEAPEAGHLSPWENPEAFNRALLEFLATV
ncbi:MAG: alpha/beta fold hydrolase [Thermoguttaceae bacterium]